MSSVTNVARMSSRVRISAAIGVAILDHQLRFVSINSTLASMNGLPVVRHYEKQLRDVLGTEARRVELAFERVFENRVPLVNFEVRAKLPYRTEMSMWHETLVPINNSDGKIETVAALVVEMGCEKTERKHISDGDLYMPKVGFDALAECEEKLRISVREMTTRKEIRIVRLQRGVSNTLLPREIISFPDYAARKL